MNILKIILAIASLVLYWQAPSTYNQGFCLICMILFLAESLILLIPDFKKKEYFTFNLFFLFCMFWVSFAYPVFIHETAAAWLGVVSEHINWDVLSKATALSLVFVSLYALGYKKTKRAISYNNISYGGNALATSKSWLMILFFLLMISAVVFLSRVGWDNAGVETFQFLYDFFYVFIILSVLLSAKNNPSQNGSLKSFIKNNKLVLIITGVFLLFYLVVGDRGPIIRVVLILFLLYYRYNPKVRFRRIFIAGFLGIVLMFFVRQTREYSDTSLVNNGLSAVSNSNVFDFGESGAVYMFADLFGIERELCAGYDYVSKYGITHAEKILLIPTYAIPFLPTVVLAPFGLKTDDYATGYILNDYLSAYNPKFGTHIVIDLYMCFGLLGVIIFAFLLGRVVSALYRRQGDNLYWTAAYIILFSLAIYLPRDSMFDLVRPLSLTFITIYFFKSALRSVNKPV